MKTIAENLMLPFLLMGLLVTLTNSCNLDETNPVVKDFDGNVYETVTIGDQVWMAENLKTTHYNDGTVIPLVTKATAWGDLTTPGFCWYDNDINTNGNTYGALYNWYAVNTDKLCPSGWHIPSDADWSILIANLNGDSIAGGKLKESGTVHWEIPNTGATNATNFTALPNGYRDTDGVYYGIKKYGFWWSSTSISAISAWNRSLSYAGENVSRPGAFVQNGFAIRCIKDE